MPWESTIGLQPQYFCKTENRFAQYDEFTAYTFHYSSGVSALRLTNQVGQIIVLPFQGQQIWDAQFYGRTLTMKSMFVEPQSTTEYLRTYGAFFVHCGVTAMGVPSGKDSHPLHGELPNASYRNATLLTGQDERGSYLGISGGYQHTVAFNHNYLAQPTIKLYENSANLSISMCIKNLKQSDMELMYLAHINFRPVDRGRLIYSACCTPEHVRVRTSVPSYLHPPRSYAAFLETLKFHPEVIFFIDYLSDEHGWAYSMQICPDGSADFVRHRPGQLDHGSRWIRRTPDEDALGIVLPATAEPEGYLAEKSKGNVRTLPQGGEFH